MHLTSGWVGHSVVQWLGGSWRLARCHGTNQLSYSPQHFPTHSMIHDAQSPRGVKASLTWVMLGRWPSLLW